MKGTDRVRLKSEFRDTWWGADIGNRVGTVAYVEVGTLVIDFDGVPQRLYLLPDKVEMDEDVRLNPRHVEATGT